MSSVSSGYFTRSSLKRRTETACSAASAVTATTRVISTHTATCIEMPSGSHILATPAKKLAQYAFAALAKGGPRRRQHVRVAYESCSNGNGSAGTATSSGAWEPAHWCEQLQNIKKMRERLDAPVDTMGCDVISDKNAKPQDYRYQVLLSLMLSSQTKDEVTSAAIARLRVHGCSVDNILRTDDAELGRLIYPVSFWKTKVLYIKKTSRMLVERFGGDVPNTVEDLCSLNGVGPKMAHLVMRSAWQQTTGIAVDTHVHRISNRLGWVRKETKKPEDTMLALHSWLPREHWDDVNWLLVGFGQMVCRAAAPKCHGCLNKDICPFGKKYVKGLKTEVIPI